MQYEICEINEKKIWNEFLDDIENSLFSRTYYLDALSLNYKNFVIKKNAKIKSIFCIILDKNENAIIDHDLIIHSGIYIIEKNLKKKIGSKNNEKYEIINAYMEFITKNFKLISVPLNINIFDVRPFLWFNYGILNSPKFKIDIKYTTIIDLKFLNYDNFFQSIFYNNLSNLRKRNLKESQKYNIEYKKIDDIDLLIQSHKENLIIQGNLISQSHLDEIENLVASLCELKQAEIQGVFIEKKLKYVICYAWDNLYAYYLFGAPVGENDYNFASTILHFHMIKKMKEKIYSRLI